MLKAFAWDLGQEFDRLQQEVNRLFGRYSGDTAGADSIRPAGRGKEADDGWHLSFDLPGVPRDALEVEVEGSMIRIRGERVTQGHLSRYERMLTLPESADPDGITAEYRDGVLELFVPKREQARPRRVEIGTGSASQETVQIESGEKDRELVGSTA